MLGAIYIHIYIYIISLEKHYTHTHIISFKPHNTSVRLVPLLPLFYRLGNDNPEKQ